jgi:hypothetical protein
MVEKMKGQPEGMLETVRRLCRGNFPAQEPAKVRLSPGAEDIKFTWLQSSIMATPWELARPYIAITVTRNTTGYSLLSYVGRFSEKDCSSSRDDDFRHEIPFGYLIGDSGSAYNDSGRIFRCVRLTDFYGRK